MRAHSSHLVVCALILGAGLWLWLRLDPWPATPDGLFHLHRVRALVEAWHAGVLYPRWFPDFAFGYGHPILNFYAPAYYPIAGVSYWLGLDLLTANRLALSGLFVLSGLACYALLQRWTSFWPALVATAIFLFFPYRLYDLFTRGALPEFAAFLWTPLLLYGYDRIWMNLRRGRIAYGWLAATALIWAGLILTHNLTALMLGIVWAMLALAASVWLWRTARQSDAVPTGPLPPGLAIFTLGAPLLIAGLTAGFYVAPVILEATWVGIGSSPSAPGYANHAARWSELWSFDLLYTYPDAAAPTVPLPGPMLLVTLGAIFLALTPWAGPLRGRLRLSLAVTLFAVWLTTTSSLPLWDLTAPILGKLQFPWRWHTVPALSVAILTALTLHTGMVHANTKALRVALRGVAAVLALYTVAYGVAGLHTTPAPYTAHDLTRAQMWKFDAEHGQVGATWTGEFLPAWVRAQRWTIGREPDPETAAAPEFHASIPGEPGIVRPIHLGYNWGVYALQLPQAQTLAFPHFYYPAWRATLAGEAVALRPAGDLAWTALDAPSGSAVLMLRWEATPGVWLGRVATAAGWLLIGGLLWQALRPHPKRRTRLAWAATGWLAVGLVGALAMTNPLTYMGVGVRSPTALDAEFGPVHLSATETLIPRPLRANAPQEQDLDVVLHWTARVTDSPIHGFVHVVDEANRVIAQYDTPIGGEYLPSSRFRPNLPLTTHHSLTLPPQTPTGDYRLLAGVYLAYAPDAPLHATGEVNPRIEIGHLEVRP